MTCLCMLHNPTLLLTLIGHLNQWDFTSLLPCHSVNCQGGPVWCIIANPKSPDQMAVGSEDGVVRLISKHTLINNVHWVRKIATAI